MRGIADKTDTPRRKGRQKVSTTPKTDQSSSRASLSKTPKPPKDQKSPKTKKAPTVKKEKLNENIMSTPPKPGQSNMKLSVSNSKIALEEDSQPLSSLDLLNDSNSSENKSMDDTLDKLSEIESDEFDEKLPIIKIPDNIRAEAGSNWRLKEAILNSFHFGKATIKAHEFAKSDSDLKTAEIVASSDHTLDSKRYRVKIHLGNINFSNFLIFIIFYYTLTEQSTTILHFQPIIGDGSVV